ncbi:CDP-alcohol phosphatidyltransferase [Mesorhizobium sp. L-8-10]|uniref:CDP-alcohol phosphatidyltransferase family protein n=1 Tax=Mesorhizobium sp. L-8-10 TaxID=2744523 RepID=UPI00192837CE|nr:CDP-alcohol phosphatidyltransferase family protein [Mesorhizobium sp. L-8-10]BCH30413.1 CDP-alcohol phosphatidyltransferase [Mesorhizobium sp. L-8-10]
MPTLYALKPAFQARLRPFVAWLAHVGVTANQVTVAAAALSIATGALIALFPDRTAVFWLFPVVLFVRMAMNAVDGMLAREHGQASRLGVYLNELGDLVSDLALTLPFVLVAPFQPWGVVSFAIMALLSECAGIIGTAAGAVRIYAGPLGKSDRALVLGALGALIASGVTLPVFASWLFPFLAALSAVTIVNRIRAGLAA